MPRKGVTEVPVSQQDRAVIADYIRLSRTVAGDTQAIAAKRVGIGQPRFSQIETAINAGDPVTVEAEVYAAMLRYVIGHREAQFREGAQLVMDEFRAKLDELEARLKKGVEAEGPGEREPPPGGG